MRFNKKKEGIFMKKEETVICQKCGNKVHKDSLYCMNCGCAIPHKKKKSKTGLIIAVVIILFIMVIGNSNESNSTQPETTENIDVVDKKEEITEVKNNEEIVKEEKEEIQYIQSSVDDMMNLLNDNALKAQETYKGNYLEVTGELRVIDSNGKYISLHAVNDPYNIIGVRCEIQNDEQRNIVMDMSKGDVVTLKGKCTSVGEVLGYSLDIIEINK